ncbi:uncharacterized protein [Physcomitrium patens]|uniref:Uncharacterized protein n=3 Tax=Physcomitrium patens TaxID=3218 RepID=A0A2K1KTT9_PHYPA|nr:hypothetical protein PHYPA_004196 [Physcomitrium patens]
MSAQTQQELAVDVEKALEIRSLLSHGIEHRIGDPKDPLIDCMQLLFHYEADGQVSNLRTNSLILSKADQATCRYFTMPGGCVRGEKCLFTHSEETLSHAEFMSLAGMGQSFAPKQVGGSKRVGAEDLRKKIFVGGLSPSVESDDLREFFEVNYGPVLDAVVIGSQAGDHMQSRGFGFVTFKHAASVSAAVEAHYINIYGKKVEIKGAVPRSELPALEGPRASDSDNPEDSHTTMSANRMLDLDEAEVLEVATPGSTLCQPKNELPQGSGMSSTSEAKQSSPPESIAMSSSNGLSSARTSQVSSDSYSQSGVRGISPESASSYELPSAKVSNAFRDSYSQPVIRGASPNNLQGRKCIWLNTFKEWLPGFLGRVSMRLKEGEWYPLSSLKGDFRAICGMELDHVSLGFEKLSDFVRSFSDLCRMKIVPVGRGPATHMVLLPPLTRTAASTANRRVVSNIATRSFVDGSRSYADVACHGTVARLGRAAGPSSNPAFRPSGASLGHQGTQLAPPPPSREVTCSADHQLAYTDGLRRGTTSQESGCCSYTAVAGDSSAGLISASNRSPRISGVPAEGYGQSDSTNDATKILNSSSTDSCRASHVPSLPSSDVGTSTAGDMNTSEVNSGLSKEDLVLLQELISRLKRTGIEKFQARNHAAPVFSPVTMRDITLSPSKSKAAPRQVSQEPMSNVETESQSSTCFTFFDHEPKTPKHGNYPPAAALNHPFGGFLHERFPSSSMWGQDVTSNRIKDGGYVFQGRPAETINVPASQFYEDSPHSNESTYGTPTGYISASSSPGQDFSKIGGMCEMCFERQALWVAVPCGHQNMCSVCKSSMRHGNQDNVQCFICNGYVERWIALH